MQNKSQNPLNFPLFQKQPTKSNLNVDHQISNQKLSDFSPARLNNLLKQKNKKINKPTQNFILQNFNNKILQCPDQQPREIINANSIVKGYQIVLICCLIMVSIASVTFSTNGTFFHVKKLTNYFNMKILGNDNLKIYQDGDNIDQTRVELTIFQDMVDHFDTLIQVLEQFDYQEGFPQFNNNHESNIKLEYINKNFTMFQEEFTLKQLEEFIKQQYLRQFILNLKSLMIKINFGQNKRVNDLNLTLKYKTYSSQMLRIQLQVDYDPNMQFQLNRNDFSIRILQQLLAFILLTSYLKTISKIQYQNQKLKKMDVFEQNIQKLQTNRLYWCYSLIILNIITVFSQTYAPMCSFLQILPVFEQNDSIDANKYNFNTNLRYSIPIILRIFIPAATLLNGFIFYSLLMYPGEYFDDYSMSLFSYFYQNFQVGTYEIFMQLQGQGNFAYFLYGILYFYMVLVANNLLPALFCTMIYIKINEKQLRNIVRRSLNTAICPNCQHLNVVKQKQKQNFQINIVSPTFSPYLKGKLSNQSNNYKKLQKDINTTKIFVQDEQTKNGEIFMKKKLERFKILKQIFQKLLMKEKIPQFQQKQFTYKLQQFLKMFYF